MVEIGAQCKDPFECDYKYHCWEHIPDYSVYDVFSRSPNKLQDVLAENIIDISDVPDTLVLT
ncbi:MAG: hypothetical protein KAQ79_05575 [Cyclobacteriaceae bacterium]|nr:hypothetical protein [Cyclobacteriaceae bacterium]